MEDIILLGITSLAGLTYLPLAASEPKHNLKAKVCESFGKVLCEPSLANVTADYLLLLSHPGTCATVLKVFSTTFKPVTYQFNYFLLLIRPGTCAAILVLFSMT